MKAGKGVRFWRPFAGVLAVSVLAFTIALEGAPTSKSGRSSVERVSGKRLAPTTTLSPAQKAATGQQLKSDVFGKVRGVSEEDAGQVIYGRIPRGDLPIMPPVVVDYRNDLPSRLRAEGKLEGPLPLRAQIVDDGPDGLAIAATYPCGSGCTFDIECADGDPCTTDNCDFTPGSPAGSGVCDYTLVADGASGGCAAEDGNFCNGREICTGHGVCNTMTGMCEGDGAAGACTNNNQCTGLCVEGLCAGGPNPGQSCKASMECRDTVATCGAPPAGEQPVNYCTTLACTDGKCVGGPDHGATCADVGACGSFTAGICDEFQDACAETCTSTAGCNAADGLICNGSETCVSGVCEPGTNPCGPGAACLEGVCTATLRPCSRDAECPSGQTCSLAGPGCYAGRCCFTFAAEPVSCNANNQCISGICDVPPGTCRECIDTLRRTSAQGPSQDPANQCEEKGGIWYATDTGKAAPETATTCAFPGAQCPGYSSGIAPQGTFLEPTIGPISDSCIPVVDSDGVGGPDTLLAAVIDDYRFEDPNGYYALDELRWVGAAARYFIEFYDENGNFIDDTSPAAVFSGQVAVRAIRFSPPLVIPGRGFVRLRNATQFTPDGLVYWATTDSVDVGSNDPGLLCINDEIVGVGTGGPCTDPLANTAAASSGVMAFEIVARPIAAEDEPRGACCDPVAGSCLEDVLSWVCKTGTCDGGDNDGEPCFRSEDCGVGFFCQTGVFSGIGQACAFCSVDSGNPFAPCPGGDGDCTDGGTCIEQCQAGACCLADGTCVPGLDTGACTGMKGTFLGFGTDCDPNCCEQPVMTGADDCQDAVVNVVTVPTFNVCVGGTNDGNFCATVGECPGGVACARRKVITITGDNSGASAPDSCFGPVDNANDDPGWWESLAIDDCAYLRIDHCCTEPIREPAYRVLYSECNPCGSAIFSAPNPHDPNTHADAGRGAPYCDKDNHWAWFGPLEAGAYWYPVFAGLSGPFGPYQLHVTIEACPEAACCTGTTCTPGMNILDCEDPSGLNGIYLGPPNKSPAVTNCIPNNANICPTGFPNCCELGGLTPGTGCGTCQTGSCCAPPATGPGTCDDQAGVVLMTQTDCNAAGGTFTGGIRCKGGTCANNPNRSCSSAADCSFFAACNGAPDQLSQPSPCPVCEIAGANNCQTQAESPMAFEISDLSAGEAAIADDFIPFGNQISTICTSGVYLSLLPESVDETPGCRQRLTLAMPSPPDKFRIRVYTDGADDGDPSTAPNRPGALFAERFASLTGSLWGAPPPRVEGYSYRQTDTTGTNSVYWAEPVSRLTDEDYQIDLSNDPITGLVLDGRRYWLEIMNNLDAAPQYDGAPSCVWAVNLAHGANDYAAQGATGEFPGAVPADVTFCIDADFDTPEAPLGACCDCNGICTDDLTLADCRSLEGRWVPDEPCGAFTCLAGPPPNDQSSSPIDILSLGDPAEGFTFQSNHQCASTELQAVLLCSDTAEPCDGCGTGDFIGHDLWYSYVPQTSATLRVSTCPTGNAWDTMIAIYQGAAGTGQCPVITDEPSCAAAAFPDADGQVASDEGCAGVKVGAGGYVERELTANTCYLFQIGSWGPTSTTPGSASVFIHFFQDLPEGACCLHDRTCFVGRESDCVDGTYQGDGTDCTVLCPCECNADVTAPFYPSPGQPTFSDIYYIVNCFKGTSSDAACDVDCDGAVTWADIGVSVCQYKRNFPDPTCCEGALGACCGTSVAPCVLMRGVSDCEGTPFDGTYLGDNTTCYLGPCDCNSNGVDDTCDTTCDGVCNVPGCGGSPDCNDNDLPDECENPDPNTIGACCLIVDGIPSCTQQSEADCIAIDGVWRGPCTQCPAQNVRVITEPGGEILVHVIGPPVDCGAETEGTVAANLRRGGPMFDVWHSPASGQMCHTFGVAGSPALPADFFGDGSDAFTGSVCLEGVDLGFPEFPGADTIIERASDPFDVCTTPSELPVTVPIQVVALSLRSVSPITVSFNGGATTETWDVFVDLSTVPSPTGSLTVHKTHCNGGVFTSTLPVQPRFTFTNTDTPTETAELDTGLVGLDPITLNQTEQLAWVSRLGPGVPVITDPATAFHPAIEEVYAHDNCDCNDNGVNDACETGGPAGGDCNFNGTLDECDITAGLLTDADEDGEPDECQSTGPSPLEPCPNLFSEATALPTGGLGGDRLSRFLCFLAPAPPAAAGGAESTAIRVKLRTMYNTAPGDPDGAGVCPSGRTRPSLSQFTQPSKNTRWVGPADAAIDNTAEPLPPDYVVAPLLCHAAQAQVRDWSPAALGAEFTSADSTRVYLFGAEVVPCSVYEVSQCYNPADDASCSEPLLVRTSRLGDCWPPFAPAPGQPAFTDINATVNKYKGFRFMPGPTPTGGSPEWHTLVDGNVVANYHISKVAKVGFLDIGETVDSYKQIPYKEDGPCNPSTGIDTCGTVCNTNP